MNQPDVIIIGAGIAGASLAWQLAGSCKVLMLEQEDSPSHHSTGRSAAIMTPYAGADLIQAASLASRAFLAAPPDGFSDAPLLSKRGVLRLTDDAGAGALARVHRTGLGQQRPLRLLDRGQLLARGLPLTSKAVMGLWDDEPCDIDVDALHQGFLRGAGRQGARLLTKHPVLALTHRTGVWHVETPAGTFQAPIVVNAAGAFASHIAALAGAVPLAIHPKRRTIAVVPVPAGCDMAHWPLIADADASFYIKPEGKTLMVCPSDETPAAPGEVYPEELDIAIAIDRMQQWLDIPVQRVQHSWAGLRSFFDDKDPVAGFDPLAEGLFWYAGQGGFGVQSAPALSRAAAAILLGQPVPQTLGDAGLTPDRLSPQRLEPAFT
ncbi:NAD(P)/FAD-dependent oxidoreductase [Pseudosulfitobacter pseudonitzschiae]|uniref:NAD(P)/FAD-dependent oxidoreductase n=1 Tax=Pseudosulfitobacter pseudonitzschiae TaxID=1402135 RepID=UPI001AFA471D|nr:FAD-dependent oxidoreductase [Pseudosulfitobacter pseudonitzschiae]MBM1814815.1 FAD-binding oxidoreductase [Pseudosulfitobacter pseudonitzschiae]MBM1831809.1 FAD-binding oxidoreductase [Pseudosulfitobacter pseudonitzschiae]MBM1836674.1 FAD-binding oxidoreductase [Pseudosulfitobacter pseudonitzschiae]MBM1841521.1 FAD-binding oxidoreductase [Pseudosulfitobacter pseudonitzschiae]MBM1846388.1 FAD-binding oxidoreductase [Pseudosulfitobacter pseudonitzschiae]